jgi:hypothetical protein
VDVTYYLLRVMNWLGIARDLRGIPNVDAPERVAA